MSNLIKDTFLNFHEIGQANRLYEMRRSVALSDTGQVRDHSESSSPQAWMMCAAFVA